MAVNSSGVEWGSVKWQDGSTYEGEFGASGQYDGMGVYVWDSGTIYRGAWRDGRMSGCGVLLSARGDGALAAHEGEFSGDEFVGSADGGGACSAADVRQAAQAADAASAAARACQLESGTRTLLAISEAPAPGRTPGQTAAAAGGGAEAGGGAAEGGGAVADSSHPDDSSAILMGKKAPQRRSPLCGVPMLRRILIAEDIGGHIC